MSNTMLFELEDDVLVRVAKTFNKTEERLNEEVNEIRKWLRTQLHLPELMDERLVRNFYLLNKCRIEKTREKIDNYYTVRSRSRDIFDTINPKLANMKFMMKTIYFLPLPKMTEDMCRVMVWKVRDPNNLSSLSPYEIIRHFINTMEIMLHEDVVYKCVVIVDASNLSMKFLLKITPMFMYKILVVIFERVYSSRIQAVYMFNCPGFVETLMGLAKKIVKPKIFSRFHFYKDMHILNEKFPKDILPQDFGGSGSSLEEVQEMLANKFVEYQDRFDQLDLYRVNEKLRSKK